MGVRVTSFEGRWLSTAGALLVFLPLAGSAKAHGLDGWSINPGIRIGYTFGEGLTLGVDMSAHYHWFRSTGVPFGGFAVGGDYTFGRTRRFARVYVDGEGGFLFGGLSLGPALIFDTQGTRAALDIAPFLGASLPFDPCEGGEFGTRGGPGAGLTLYYRRTVYLSKRGESEPRGEDEIGVFGKGVFIDGGLAHNTCP